MLSKWLNVFILPVESSHMSVIFFPKVHVFEDDTLTFFLILNSFNHGIILKLCGIVVI